MPIIKSEIVLLDFQRTMRWKTSTTVWRETGEFCLWILDHKNDVYAICRDFECTEGKISSYFAINKYMKMKPVDGAIDGELDVLFPYALYKRHEWGEFPYKEEIEEIFLAQMHKEDVLHNLLFKYPKMQYKPEPIFCVRSK